MIGGQLLSRFSGARRPKLHRPKLHRPMLHGLALAATTLILSGCQAVVLDPPGTVAARQRDLLVEATGLMLLIIVPVMAATVLFAWRYRAANTKATYEPDWDHSTKLELLIWAAPLMIIICLGALTWAGTHLLDPYRPLKLKGATQPPLRVEVVSLDWKWLFFYPQYGVATVNELAAPVGRAIDFDITSSSVMNSFFVPALAGQIYAMPGMQTQLHAMMPKAGVFPGLSAQYSGAGFSGMHFHFQSMPAADFDRWIASVRASPLHLDRADYLQLAKPSELVVPIRYGEVDPTLYNAVLNECVEPGRMCLSQMMAIDAHPGGGEAMPGMKMPAHTKRTSTPPAINATTGRPTATDTGAKAS